MAYRVFVRNWYRREGGRIVPGAGRKTVLFANVESIERVRAICSEYNETHKPGPLSRKAEFESK